MYISSAERPLATGEHCVATHGIISAVSPRRSLARSLSAVSEAPTSEELGVETLCRGASIQRLEGSRPWGLWDLYLGNRS
jgi:hypothetical protein